MPAFRGTEPTSRAQSASLNATAASLVAVTEASRGKAQSSSSITTPFRAGNACSSSSRFRSTSVSGPNIWPEAILNNNAYPIWPAAPVTATRTRFMFTFQLY
jgi:hypothetical protein